MRAAIPEGVTPALYLAYFRNRYNDTIKHWISIGRNQAAKEMIAYLMENITLLGFADDIKARIHCGPEFCHAAKFLEEMLETGDAPGIKVGQEQFEAYAAQTRLPKSPH